ERAGRPSGIEPAALHLRFPLRAPADHGPLHHARRRGTGVAESEDRPEQSDTRSGLDISPELRAAAGFSRWIGGLDHRPHGGDLYFSQVREGPEHEPGMISMSMWGRVSTCAPLVIAPEFGGLTTPRRLPTRP